MHRSVKSPGKTIAANCPVAEGQSVTCSAQTSLTRHDQGEWRMEMKRVGALLACLIFWVLFCSSTPLCLEPSPYFENFALRYLLVLHGCNLSEDDRIEEVQKQIEENQINNFGLVAYKICTDGDNNLEILKAKQALLSALSRAHCLHVSPPIAVVVASEYYAGLSPLAKSLGLRLITSSSSSGQQLASTLMTEINKYNSIDKDISCSTETPVWIENGWLLSGLLHWRHTEPWLAAAAAVAALGTCGALAIVVFLTVRVCQGHLLEGHPGLSYLLLISIVLSYACVLPYSVVMTDNEVLSMRLEAAEDVRHQWNRAVCLELARSLWPGVGCGLVFCGMASRAVMLASCDSDGGLISYVNGYLQATIFFFMLLVQGCMSTVLVLVAPVGLELALPATLGYCGFLLVLMILLIPRAIRSRRNYREGKHLAICSLILGFVWTLWLVLILLLPPGWHEYCHVAGTHATASLVLVVVLVPRTYAMTAALSRDRVTAAITPSAFCGLPVDQPLQNFRPINEMAVASPPPPPPPQERIATVAQPQGTTGSLENTYTQFDTPPNPHKITHF